MKNLYGTGRAPEFTFFFGYTFHLLQCPNEVSKFLLVLSDSTATHYYVLSSQQTPAWMDTESWSSQLPLHLYLYSANLQYLRAHMVHPAVLTMVNAACNWGVFISSVQNQSLEIPSSLGERITKERTSKGLISSVHNWLASGSNESSASKLAWNEKLKQFWREVKNKIKIILSVNITLDSRRILLHLYPADLDLGTKDYKFMDVVILPAKWMIAFNQKETCNLCSDQKYGAARTEWQDKPCIVCQGFDEHSLPFIFLHKWSSINGYLFKCSRH